jgi:hypothetical protein
VDPNDPDDAGLDLLPLERLACEYEGASVRFAEWDEESFGAFLEAERANVETCDPSYLLPTVEGPTWVGFVVAVDDGSRLAILPGGGERTMEVLNLVAEATGGASGGTFCVGK